MRLSKYYLPTLRELPADAEIPSHKLMLRAAMIRKSASGLYSYLPLGYKVVRKVEQIVREEMDRAGALEVNMTLVQPREIWDEAEGSGRWGVYGPEMFKLEDRHGRDFCLSPTAEEYFTSLVKGEVKSYKQLPLNIYQINRKFRDEKRPRFGVNRSREFEMKDAYTFDKDEEGLQVAYDNMYQAYEKVFDRLGIDYRVCEGDNGAMGGKISHEFTALAGTGEGVIVYTEDGTYAATDEQAEVHYTLPPRGEQEDLEKVHTPGATTIEEVADFLGLPTSQCVKALDFTVAGEPVFVFIPGDRELNEAKFLKYLKVPEHEVEMMEDELIKKAGSHPGFTGPHGLTGEVRIILDRSVREMNNVVIGANEADYHYKNANFGRDFDGEDGGDLLMVQEGDLSPDGKELLFARGIEVGNIFQLGQKYAKDLNATFLDENGKEQYFYMGSYGIGITRSVSALIDQNNDEDGIIWPVSVAPFEAVVTIVNTKKEEQVELAEKIYQDLLAAGIDVLLDDRNERAGVKFKDRDLIGIPYRISVGKGASEDMVEYSTRVEKENHDVPTPEAVQTVIERVQAERN